MKKYIFTAGVAAIFTGLSFAQSPAPAPKASSHAAEAAAKDARKVEHFTATISAINTVKNEITVKTGKGVERVLSVESAKIFALKAGDHVTIRATDNRVKSIKVIKKYGDLKQK